METRVLGLANFGLPRSGTMRLNCASDKGWASGSAFAALRISRSSATVGMRIAGFLDLVDIMLHLAARSGSETDDSALMATIDIRNVIERAGIGRERDHAQLVVVKSVVDPDERRVPIQLRRQRQRNAMLDPFDAVFSRIKREENRVIYCSYGK